MDISSGGHHTVFLTENDIFVCGKGANGQLGLNDNKNYVIP